MWLVPIYVSETASWSKAPVEPHLSFANRKFEQVVAVVVSFQAGIIWSNRWTRYTV